MIMSEPLELQAQRPYALDQLTMLQSQIMQTIQGMVVLRTPTRSLTAPAGV